MQICNKEDIKSLDTILFIGAHPDDETFCAGGLMASAASNGQNVYCLTLTRGEGGSQDKDIWPQDQMAETRTKELKEAFKILGIKDYDLLDLPDGGLAQIELTKGRDLIRHYIEKYQPDTILTFGPDGFTGHPDHQTVSAWVNESTRQLDNAPTVYQIVITDQQYQDYFIEMDDKLNIFFKTNQPPIRQNSDCDICFSCFGGEDEVKVKALLSMTSQYTKMNQQFDLNYLKKAFATEAFVKAKN